MNSASHRMKIHQKVHDDNVDILIIGDMWTKRFLIESVSLMRRKNTRKNIVNILEMT